MHTNYTNKTVNAKIIYPELSYFITGICFDIHNKLGRFCREKQYGDQLELKLKELKVFYLREYKIGDTGNIADFLVDDKILLELKAKRLVLKEDYYQIQRYLQVTNKQLGLIINFRNRFLKPLRIIKINTEAKKKFLYSLHSN